MGQVNLGALVIRLRVWVNHMWRILLKNIAQMTLEAMGNEAKKNSKLAKSSGKMKNIIPNDVRDYFKVGYYVQFIDSLGGEDAWGFDDIEYKIMKNYIGRNCKIIGVDLIDGIPAQYNLFVSVEFKDGYTLYNVSYYAFGPPVHKVYDFEKERLRRLKLSQGDN